MHIQILSKKGKKNTNIFHRKILGSSKYLMHFEQNEKEAIRIWSLHGQQGHCTHKQCCIVELTHFSSAGALNLNRIK